METKEVVKLWKELGITEGYMDFSCGGDSFHDYEVILLADGESVGEPDLKKYFEDEVFNNVSFYEASDGHYMGEAGRVEIELEDSDDEPYFMYSKNAEAEWSETHESESHIELTEEMVEFIKKNVDNINGGDWGAVQINFKRDFIMTDREEELVDEIGSAIDDYVVNYEPEDSPDGNIDDWYTFSTNPDGEDITIEGNNELKLYITNSFIIYTPSE